MLYFPLTKPFDSSEVAVASGAVMTTEGQALIRAATLGVTVSAGAAGEVFAGFSIIGVSANPLTPAYNTKVETFTVPASGIVSLAFAPVAGQVGVYDNTTSAQVAAPTVVGQTVTTLTVGDIVTVTYRYALTVNQAKALVGDNQPGGYAGAVVAQVGVVKRGIVYTTEFDASKNWAAATAIKLAAGGQVTDQTGTGVAIQGYVVEAPSVTNPYLGIEFSAA
jgi:hypothetical protein